MVRHPLTLMRGIVVAPASALPRLFRGTGERTRSRLRSRGARRGEFLLAWYTDVERLGAARAGLFVALLPVASALGAAALGTGMLTTSQVVGCSVVALGLVVHASLRPGFMRFLTGAVVTFAATGFYRVRAR